MSGGYQLAENVSLAGRNTFRVPARAAMMADVSHPDALPELFDFAMLRDGPVMVLGEGSNLLFAGDFPGVVVCLAMHGARVLRDDGDSVLVRAEAGLNWNDLVHWTLGRGLCGLENMALIPGTVGASPIQNIGAYGVEVRQFIETVEAFHRGTGQFKRLSNADCGFGYRDSVFKADLEAWVVTAVEFRLPRELPLADAEALAAAHPGLPVFPAGPPERRKVSAAWLIEQAGWKGFREGDAGVSAQHALVLVNHGSATGAQLLDLARRVAASVRERFGVALEPEPRIIGATW